MLGKYALTWIHDKSFPYRQAWVQTDCTVLTWIYDTISNDLLQLLMLCQFSTHGACRFLKGKFLGQRNLARSSSRHGSMNISDYCCRLESMATSLAEYGDPIGDRQMVLTLLHGLNDQFHHMVSILKMHFPFPTF